MERGRFIVVEGLDGSGKSTQISALAQNLQARGYEVFLTAEPTDYETGAYIRRILSESLSKNMYLQAALFLADRLEHITHPEHGIKKQLEKGKTVICDRYYYSSFAYQGTQSDMDWVMDINLNCAEILRPDMCVFLDVDPMTCKTRLDCSRAKLELYEKDVEILRSVRQNFLDVFRRLQESENIRVIKADREQSAVAKDVLHAALEVLD